MKTTLMIVLSVGVLVAGCSQAHKPDSTALQGKWSGEEIGGQTQGASSVVFDGTQCEFHGANTQEWYKATFVLREDTTPKQLEAVISECPFAQYVGKATRGIYKVEDGKLTFAANEPGNSSAPTSFDAKGARKFVLTRQ